MKKKNEFKIYIWWYAKELSSGTSRRIFWSLNECIKRNFHVSKFWIPFHILTLLFYNRRRLWRFWMVSSKFLMMTDEKWLNICKNHEGSVKKEVRKIFTYTFEIFLVVMWIFERVICSSVFIEKKWYVYDRHLVAGKMYYSALINILLYCTKIFLILRWRTIDFGLYAPHFFLFCAYFCIYMHVLHTYLGTFSKYGKYFTQLSSKVGMENDFFSISCLIP